MNEEENGNLKINRFCMSLFLKKTIMGSQVKKIWSTCLIFLILTRISNNLISTPLWQENMIPTLLKK
jgi:hypothetical protein